MKNNKAHEHVFKKSKEIDGTIIKGYDFNNGVDYEKIIDSFKGVGFQATKLSKAIDITNEMIKEKAYTYLGFTSNMSSSGNREIIRWLIEHKKIDVAVTTSGAIEEDIIKCMENFHLGDFNAKGADLRKKGINRIGDIFVPNSRYIKFEEFFQPILKELMQQQKQTNKIITPKEIIWKLGEKINNEDSICYWAYKNQIPIFCPAITDGALGDNVYFFKTKNPEFKIEVTEDIKAINDTSAGKDKTGVIILGAGVIKHHILNVNLFRNGADYAVFINTAQEYNGSDAGALPEEAIAWGKLRTDSKSVKVHGDATILFPLLVAKTFAQE